MGLGAKVVEGVLGGILGTGGSSGGAGVNIPPSPAPPVAKSEQPDKTNFGAQPGAASVPTFLGVNSSM